MKNKSTAVLLLLIACFSTQLQAKIEQNLEKPDTLFLGSIFQLNITSNEELREAKAPDTLTAFSILKQEPLLIKKKSCGLKLTIAALDTGKHAFPALVVLPMKSRSDTLKTLPFRLEILDTREAEDSVLADIAPTQKLRWELPWWAYYAIPAGLALIILSIIIYLIYKRRKKKALEPPREPVMRDNRPNWKKALEALYELNQENLPAKGEFIAFHFRLSDIMKQFLEDDYSFPAKEMTCREIRQYFRQKVSVNYEEGKEITNWLDGCDLVKFAKQVPTIEECGERLDWFFRWLMQKRAAAEQENGEGKAND